MPLYEYSSERWAPVEAYQGLYEVSDRGRVKRLRSVVVDSKGRRRAFPERMLQPSGKRYLCVRLSKGGVSVSFRVHQLVLGAFVGPCPADMECCHNNGDRQDNRLQNLRYDTRKGNMADKQHHGTANKGERHGGATLTKDEVLSIRRLRAEGTYSLQELASLFNISMMTVSDVANFRSWTHVGGSRPTDAANQSRKLTSGAVRAIRLGAAAGVSQRRLATQFGVNQSTVSRIVRRLRRVSEKGC